MQSSINAQPAVGLYRAYQAARNPVAAIQQMAAQNPMLAQLRQMQTGGTDMKQAFYSLCEQRGVNPDEILSQFM